MTDRSKYRDRSPRAGQRNKETKSDLCHGELSEGKRPHLFLKIMMINKWRNKSEELRSVTQKPPCLEKEVMQIL